MKEYKWFTNVTTAEEYHIDQSDVHVYLDENNQVQILKIVWVFNSDAKLIYGIGFVIEITICILIVVCYTVMACILKQKNKVRIFVN